MAKTAAVALVAAALVGGWWFVTEDVGVHRRGTPTIVGVETTGAVELEPARVAEQDATSPVVAAADVARETLLPSPATSTLADERWMLRVTLDGDFDGAADNEAARITVRGKWTSQLWPKGLEVTSTLARPGSVLLDVSELIAPSTADGTRRPAVALQIEGEHSACVSAQLELELSANLDFEHPPAEPLEARLALNRGAVIVGRVEPAGAGDGLAQVLALERRDGAWTRAPVAMRVVAADGAFRLVLPRGGAHIVGAAALGLRPASRVIDARVGTTVDLGVLRLERGAALSGRVRAGNATSSGLSVYSVLDSDAPSVHCLIGDSSADSLAIVADRLEWRVRWFEADAEGRFEVAGLAPGEAFWLRASWPLWGKVQTVPMASEIEAPRIVAPKEGIELEFGRSKVELVLDVAEGTEVRGTLTAQAAGDTRAPIPIQLKNRTVHLLGVPSREAVVLDLDLDGFDPERLELQTPPAGETAVLHVSPERRDLAALMLQFEGAVPAQGTLFFVHDLTDPLLVNAYARQPRPTLLMDDLARQRTLEDGRLHIEDLKPGLRRLLLYPGSYMDSRTTYLLDVELDIEVAAGERLERTVELVEGGRLRFDVTDCEDRPAAARVDLHGPSGLVPLSFIARSGEGARGSSGTLHPSGPNDVLQNLPAARYRLRLELEGHATEELDIEVLPGERTEVQVRMRRR